MSFFPFRIGLSRRTTSAATRQRVISAPIEEDPYQMPRWWPGVERMEGVEDDRFTQVFKSRRSRRTVRADFHVLASEPPGGQYTSGHRTWEQDVAGTPFETVLAESITEIAVEPADGGTRVMLAQRQKLRGYSRTGAWAMRGATNKRLDEALEGLTRLFG